MVQPHEYATSVYDQPWFSAPGYPADMPAIWDRYWGYLHRQNTAPLMMGEFGTTLANPVDEVWLENLMACTGTGVDGIPFTYWSWNPGSGDTGGIVGDDWTTVNRAKQSIPQPYLIPPTSGGPGTTTTTTTGGGTGACKAAWKLDKSWQGGFQGSLTVTSTAASAANPRKIAFTLPGGATISNGWNGTYSQSGAAVTVTAPSHSRSRGAGAAVSLGFTANGPAGAPSAVTLDQAVCTT
ncbi:cellulose binding domain-containing protein [Lentzea sp. DG1S-22]|uniref:cellulose binding domain-containing protein n=1 Tax=Lentzea sp. DG1S-22 TaxID=3108822 RepID=UPI002E77E3A9|nr:cellulose binding domain-containing protein [Lentzea sp. DG1S-22]WVH83703.1 cellulose binding domain-containing protein [Lentzea sp. DG1S-22]